MAGVGQPAKGSSRVYKRSILIISLSFCLLIAAAVASSSSPNFVVIFTDDQGYGDVGCFGGTHVQTPNLDRLAAEGTRLTDFYVPAPLCTPSRAGLMTGTYPARIGMATGSNFVVLLAGDTKGLHPDEVTLAEALKGAGYATGLFGKWHLGDQPEFLPTRQGFDEFFGLPYSHDIHPYHPRQSHFKFPSLPLLDGETVVEMDPNADFLTQRIHERAVRFIEKNRERPFFLYFAHPIPHKPLHVSPEFMQGVSLDVRQKLQHEAGSIDYDTRDKLFPQAIREIDWSVGDILSTLKKHGLDRKTLVLFTSDNGPAVGSAGPLRGRKGSTFEGGMREPAIVWWPGQIPAGKVSQELMTSMDVLPTFAHLAGASLPGDRVIDGRNIWPLLSGQPGAQSPHSRFFYYRQGKLEAVRSGLWKLHLAAVEAGAQTALPSPALFHLGSDIGETKDVSKEHPEIVERLMKYLDEFKADIAAHNRPAGFVDNPVPLKME